MTKVAVITGGAGDIGRATGRRLLADGVRVLLVDRDQAALDGAVAELEGEGQVTGIAADVTQAADVARYAAAAAELGGGEIHMFFNNAGVEGPVGNVVDLDEDAFDAVIAVNVRGVFLGMKYVLPYMRSGAAIVNTGSTGSLYGTPEMSAYVASKHAVLGLTRSVAKEVALQNIRINTVCPGPVRGRMIAAIHEARTGDIGAATPGEIPLGRMAAASEIAELVVFLLSDAASYMTGGTYPVDGGRRA